MDGKVRKINELLVAVYDDINMIEETAIRQGDFSDLSIKEIHLIDAVGLYETKIMSELASAMKVTMGTITTSVDKLIRKGYIERNRSNTDRRNVCVKLTQRGKLAYRIHEKFHLDMVEMTLDQFTEEEENILLIALDKLNKHLKNDV